jgi:dihydropteroate synthase
LLAFALSHPEEWAQEDVLRAIRERYETTSDWNAVRSAFEQEFASFTQNGHPVLAGISRKSMLGKITGREVGDRLVPSIAAAVLAAERGASIVRVHDVPETIDALTVWAAAQTE